MSSKTLYQVGGNVQADNDTYVQRKADSDLFDYLVRGELCCVSNSRQMGKSSLAVQAKEKLKPNIICAIVDLHPLSGKEITKKDWYLSIAVVIMDYLEQELPDHFNLRCFNWKDDWKNSQLDDPYSRWDELLKKILKVINEINKSIVIFFDEIDALRTLEFENHNFLAGIRAYFNYRASRPIFNRITFCLIGVGTPSDLLENEEIKMTPFNIGKRIELRGFTLDEAQNSRLDIGLENCEDSKAVLREIIKWTNGQPLLTQHLCSIVSEDPETRNPVISDLVEKEYMISKTDPQEHFKTIKDRIIDNPNTVALLEMYKRILEDNNKKIVANDLDAIQIELRLSGLVIRTPDGYLEPFNLIYERIFDLTWVKQKIEWVNEQLANIKPYTQKLEAWQTAIEEQKQLYLLYGDELENAQKWKEGKTGLTEQDFTFLRDSQDFWRDAQKKIPEKSNYELIIKEMNDWTGGQKFFNDTLFEIFTGGGKKPRKAPTPGTEKKWVEDLVKGLKKSIENTIDKPVKREYLAKVQAHKTKIDNSFLNDSSIDPFWLLFSYREILESGEVDFNDSTEHTKLATMDLIIKEGNKLKILNKIYRYLFDHTWVSQKLLGIRPYANSFIAWKDSFEDQSHLLQKDDLDKALTWLKNNEISKELEIKFIITSLIAQIWQSATEEEKSEAVKIVIKFNPQLKRKTNPLYGFIQKVLEHTASDCNLLAKLLEKACEKENIRSEKQDEWIEQQLDLLKPNDIISQEILAWIQSYEKAIVAKNRHSSKAKEIIDIAFYELVKQLAEFPNHTKPQNSDIDTVIHCINYLADNLIRLGIWEEDDRPDIIKLDGENRWKITVSNCSYQEECKWALDEPAFDKENEEEKYKKYRCQRLGCCVGAVKKNMTDDKLPVDQKNQLGYFMTTVMESTEEAEKKCRCEGVIFVNKNLKL